MNNENQKNQPNSGKSPWGKILLWVILIIVAQVYFPYGFLFIIPFAVYKYKSNRQKTAESGTKKDINKIIFWTLVVCFFPFSLFFLNKIKKERQNDSGDGSSDDSSDEKQKDQAESNSVKVPQDNDLPEENAPDVDKEQLMKDDHIVLPMCITWLAQRGKKHGIAQNTWNRIRTELIQIKRRMTESTLYLGVIGDASVGKSTFINALLGFEFLKENVTLGTTSTATILKKGDEFSIKVNYNGNRPSVTYSRKDLNLPEDNDFTEYSPEVAQVIAGVTAIEKEEEAAAIRSVEVYLPIQNELLESNIAIVDTPGLHSGNAWHDAATTNAVKNICDIALILTSAKTPLPNNFIDYLKSNLSSVLPRSILVMTQADTLDEDERDEQLDYIHSRLKPYLS